MRRIVLALVALRVFVAVGLILTPALDEASEFDGWDIERFQEIHDSPGQAYVDFEVEYPPGSLALIEVVTLGSGSGESNSGEPNSDESNSDDSDGDDSDSDGVLASHRALTVLSLLVDLAIAAILFRCWSQRTALAYLVIGTPMIVFGLTRFDLWACLLAVAGLALSNLANAGKPNARRSLALDTAAGTAIAAGALVKLWPALLIVVLWAVGRRRPAVVATVVGSLCGFVWIAISGTDAVQQVLSLRGATGWQVESLGGTLTSLLTSHEAVYQANAYRIGSIDKVLVTLGQVVAICSAVGLSWLAARSSHPQRVPLAMLGSVAALIVTAPLLSPQFLLWLLPWAAMLATSTSRLKDPTGRVLLVTAMAVALTAAVLSFGPPNLHHTIPAAILLARNCVLLALVPLTGSALATAPEPTRHATGQRMRSMPAATSRG